MQDLNSPVFGVVNAGATFTDHGEIVGEGTALNNLRAICGVVITHTSLVALSAAGTIHQPRRDRWGKAFTHTNSVVTGGGATTHTYIGAEARWSRH